MFTDRTTCLKFNDFISDPIPLKNGTTQGDPSSMLYFGFYNAPLIKTTKSEDELSLGFVDDSMMLVMGDSLEICHVKLKDMMERPGGGFEWSLMHNSPFELSKTVLMNFPRSYRDPIPSDLRLDKPNEDGTVTSSLTKTVASYKYLGIIFDPGLHWTLHQAKVLATTTFWSSQIWRLQNQLLAFPHQTQSSYIIPLLSPDSHTVWRYGIPTFTDQRVQTKPEAP
jgi:hypothetical protein